jgi:hypothetical protein
LSNFRFNGKSRYIPPWATIGKDGNQANCDLCYCYVCDKPAKDCQVRCWQLAPHRDELGLLTIVLYVLALEFSRVFKRLLPALSCNGRWSSFACLE